MIISQSIDIVGLAKRQLVWSLLKRQKTDFLNNFKHNSRSILLFKSF